MTDVPIRLCLGIGGRGGGAQAPCRTKRPLGLQRKVTDPYCVCFKPCQWLFLWLSLQRLALSKLMSAYAIGQMLEVRNGMVGRRNIPAASGAELKYFTLLLAWCVCAFVFNLNNKDVFSLQICCMWCSVVCFPLESTWLYVDPLFTTCNKCPYESL